MKIERINEILEQFKSTQTSFQNQFFVVQKQGSAFAQYQQSLRELSGRVDNLRNNHFQLERLKIDIEEIEYKLTQDLTVFEKKRLDIDHREKSFQIAPLERSIKETAEDVELFYKNAIYLKNHLENEYGTLTKEKMYELETKNWEEKVRDNIAMDWSLTGQVSKSSLEFLNSLPLENKKDIVADMELGDKIVKDFQEKENFQIDSEKLEMISISGEELKKLM